MLKKLIYYEIRATYRLALLFFALLLLLPILGRLFLAFHQAAGLGKASLSLFLFFYGMALASLFVGLFLYLGLRYYRNLFCEQGYLMHTLPVSTDSLWLAKYVTDMGYLALFWIVLTLSVALCGLIPFELDGPRLDLFQDMAKQGRIYFQITGGVFPGALLLLLFFALSSAATLAIIFVSVAVGSTRSKNRTLITIGSFAAIYTAMQLLFCLLMALYFQDSFALLFTNGADSSAAAFSFLPVCVMSDAVLTALLLWLNHFLLKKKLNLI